ncbi:hemerythrin domain-containing protein [Pacificimonas sp. WHA3]|uniref:Hemerythrin domain-containing protein n=1 Tax=Pacificimonas pallii TaxID=2827236 RepID=A0ABS6SG88_9SPHN|nr:hemerythrin domain-containing protein [Pacificimonas pallii]MBV7257058.1 hemerythrin domain-containing protein [Pacificimonas pallii]
MADILELLKKDHETHRGILSDLAKASGAARQTLFGRFKAEALAHANAEEQSLYAAMMSNPKQQDEARHAVAEHKEIDDYVEDLEKMDMHSDEWMSKFLKLKHRYEHHIDEEEEEMFVTAARALSDEKRKELGTKFSERRKAEEEKLRAA